MKDIILIYFFICFFSVGLGSRRYEYEDHTMDEENTIDDGTDDNSRPGLNSKVPTETDTERSNCWMTLNASEYCKILDDIYARYANVRERVQESLKDFNSAMIDGFKRSRGQKHHGRRIIPSGLNLGGYSTLGVSNTVLFFHRMKLRNDTCFRVDYLHNNLSNMIVRIDLSLDDLYLKGAFERSLNTVTHPSVLIYIPTLGQVEFLLKNVTYTIEGRYSLINNRLLIELVKSRVLVSDVLMTYINYNQANSAAIKVEKENLGNFMDKMQRDLDKWIKDYLNEDLIYADIAGIPNIKELAKFDNEKRKALEEFTDNSIHAIATRIRLLNADCISLPPFIFETIRGQHIKLHKGVITGLDSMYRRSVATGSKNKDVHLVESVVGFRKLTVVYKYQASIIPRGMPPVIGTLTLTANQVTACLTLAMVSDPETVDVDIKFLDHILSDSLTVDGAANIMIANFKRLLEHQVLTTMSNSLIQGKAMIKSLARCVPFIPGRFKGMIGPVQHKYNNEDKREAEENNVPDSESKEMLSGKRFSTKHPKSLNIQ